MDDSQDINQPNLLARIRQSRAALEHLIAPLGAAELTAPGPAGWSIKDHLAHLSAWRGKLLAMIEGRPVHEGLQIDQQTYQASDETAINELLYNRNRDRSLTEILVEFRQSHQQVLAALEALPEADLFRPANPAEPDNGLKLINFVVGNTCGHDDEHVHWIKALLAV